MVNKVMEDSSIIIVGADDTSERFLMARYSDTYPKPAYRGRVNLMGGGQHPMDAHPIKTLRREFKEEFDPDRAIDNSWAPSHFIRKLRDCILTGAAPYGDFLSIVPSFPHGLKRKAITIDHTYSVYLPTTLFDAAQEHISRGNKIVCEGELEVVTAEQLKSGNPLTAWSTGHIMTHHLGKEIPNPNDATVFYLRSGVHSFERCRELFQYEPLSDEEL
jgi:hypothetical protein